LLLGDLQNMPREVKLSFWNMPRGGWFNPGDALADLIFLFFSSGSYYFMNSSINIVVPLYLANRIFPFADKRTDLVPNLNKSSFMGKNGILHGRLFRYYYNI